MIIFGYPGIGKTTIAKDDYRFIDLDSGDPLIHGKYFRKKNWEEDYCNTALLLHKQGYFVFVSTHPEVIDRIVGKTKDVCVVFPDISLRKEWVRRLRARYDDRKDRQTHNAWKRASEHFDNDIYSLNSEKCAKIRIPNMDFNVKKAILALAERG